MLGVARISSSAAAYGRRSERSSVTSLGIESSLRAASTALGGPAPAPASRISISSRPGPGRCPLACARLRTCGGTGARCRVAVRVYASRSSALVLRLERRALLVAERLEDRAGAGAGDPSEHRIRSGEHVQVRGLPGVDVEAEPGQDAEVGRGVRCGRAARGRRSCRRTVGPRRARAAAGGSGRRSWRGPGARANRPGPSAAARCGSRSRWSGTHWRVALVTITSTGSSGTTA